MDYQKVLKKIKFQFEWSSQLKEIPEVMIEGIGDGYLQLSGLELKKTASLASLKMSIKIGQVWHHHSFNRFGWREKQGKTLLLLEGPNSSLRNMTRNLQLGLCV